MRRSGGAAIHMRDKGSDLLEKTGTVPDQMLYLAGDAETVEAMSGLPAREPFAGDILRYLSEVSKALMADTRTRNYPDVVTFAFWIRRASMEEMKARFPARESTVRLGRGITFHIAPSNVPVNFAYSLAVGLLTGNACIVRVPPLEFAQVGIIADAFRTVAGNSGMSGQGDYLALVRYGHEQEINDLFSGMADIRIIWGGDTAIGKIRRSPLKPGSTDLTFADRYSVAVVDADAYLKRDDKDRMAQEFYNDTYLMDQNACTSPGIVIWTGTQRETAKAQFWDRLYREVCERYTFQQIQGVDKLTAAYLVAARVKGAQVICHGDNRLVRVSVPKVDAGLMDLRTAGGFFLEYDCGDVMELKDLLNDRRCQTAGIWGSHDWLAPLLDAGIKGLDRITDTGHTMDFDLIWDGYDLVSALTRTVKI